MRLREALETLEMSLIAVIKGLENNTQLTVENRIALTHLISALEKELRLANKQHGDFKSLSARSATAIKTARKILDGDFELESLKSVTKSVLRTQFVSPTFEDKGPIAHGVHRRFLKPTPPPVQPNTIPRRVISATQATTYKRVRDEVIHNEQIYGTGYYCFYHAQDPRMRIAQDLYRRVYEKYTQEEIDKDFYFFRFPTPVDSTFSKYSTANEFLIDKIRETGMIDDNDAGTKLHIISANLSLFGSMGHAGEETFHYFQIGKGQTELNPTSFIQQFFQNFGFDESVVPDLMKAASLIDSSEGSMFQIFVPKNMVDIVAFLAHPHGIPFDDQLLDDMHSVGDIRYRWEKYDEDMGNGMIVERRRLAREKMNDELTRKLKLFPRHTGAPQTSQPLKSALKKSNTPRVIVPPTATELEDRENLMASRFREHLNELTQRTIERVTQGQYLPSRALEKYSQSTHSFVSPELHHHKAKLQPFQGTPPPATKRDPYREHWVDSKSMQRLSLDELGHGRKSPHELMRIQNRALFMQARLLLTTHHMLNPKSGIKIIRHTTVPPEEMASYQELLDRMCDTMLKPKSL
jgi:hypothetical protein